VRGAHVVNLFRRIVFWRHWLPPLSVFSDGPVSVVIIRAMALRVGVFAMAPNVFGLGDGGDFHHKR